ILEYQFRVLEGMVKDGKRPGRRRRSIFDRLIIGILVRATRLGEHVLAVRDDGFCHLDGLIYESLREPFREFSAFATQGKHGAEKQRLQGGAMPSHAAHTTNTHLPSSKTSTRRCSRFARRTRRLVYRGLSCSNAYESPIPFV